MAAIDKRTNPDCHADLVRSFEEAGILQEVTGQSRNRMYLFGPYLDKFRE